MASELSPWVVPRQPTKLTFPPALLSKAMYAMKLPLGILAGIICGAVPLTGWAGWGVAAVALNLFPVVWAWSMGLVWETSQAGGDEEEEDEEDATASSTYTAYEVAVDTLQPALGVFLVCWIGVYSAIHTSWGVSGLL
jgi:hypothetical protein